MTAIKLDSKLGTNAGVALEPLAQHLFRTPGSRIVIVAELAAVERTEPAPDEDKERSVKLAIKNLEVGTGEKEHVLRDALRALYALRTASGTLDENQTVELSERTLELTAGRLPDVDAAEVRVGVRSWRHYLEQTLRGDELTREQLLNEIKTVVDGLGVVLRGGIDL